MCDGVQIFLVKKELNLNYNKKAIYRYTEVQSLMWNFVQNFESNCDITHVKSKIKKITGTIGIIYLNLLNENLFVYLNRACLSFCTY